MSESYLEDINLSPHAYEATEGELTEDQLLDSLFDIRCIKSKTGWESPLPMSHQRKLKEEPAEPAVPHAAFNSVRNVQKIKTFAVKIKTEAPSGFETAMPTMMCPEIPPGVSLLRRANPNLAARFKQQPKKASIMSTTSLAAARKANIVLNGGSNSARRKPTGPPAKIEQMNNDFDLTDFMLNEGQIDEVEKLTIDADFGLDTMMTPYTPQPVRPAAGESEAVVNATRSPKENRRHMNDHCYTRNEEVDALVNPSDSEEDIDVVSLDYTLLDIPIKSAHGTPLSKTVLKKKTQQISPTVGYAYKNVSKTNLTTQNSYSTTYASKAGTTSTRCNKSNALATAPTSVAASAIVKLGAEKSAQYFVSKQNRCAAQLDENMPGTKKHRLKSRALCTPSSKDRGVLRLNPSDYLNKRTLHNNMERQRRVSLGVMFSALKETVPSCKNKDRAPKVHILREASKYATFLSKTINDSRKVKERLQALIQGRLDLLRELELEISKAEQ